MTDPFARFGVEHLSATSMLQFRSDPALGVLYLVFKIREAGSPAMHRGSALDHTIGQMLEAGATLDQACLLYTSPSPRDGLLSRMPSSA